MGFISPSFLPSLSDSSSNLTKRAVQVPAGWRWDRHALIAAVAPGCSVQTRSPWGLGRPRHQNIPRWAAGGSSSRGNGAARPFSLPQLQLQTELQRKAARTKGTMGIVIFYFAIFVRLRVASRYVARAASGGRSARAVPAPWRRLRDRKARELFLLPALLFLHIDPRPPPFRDTSLPFFSPP